MLGLLPKPMPASAARVEPVDSLSLSLSLSLARSLALSLSLFRHLRHAAPRRGAVYFARSKAAKRKVQRQRLADQKKGKERPRAVYRRLRQGAPLR